MDGEWEAPQVPNPACESAPGCGAWQRPAMDNPNYKGKWKPAMIDNPNYQVGGPGVASSVIGVEMTQHNLVFILEEPYNIVMLLYI